MADSSFITVQGFRSFTSLWHDACAQISQETNKTVMDNDIKLFRILRNIMLASEPATFMHSAKLSDFSASRNPVHTTINTPSRTTAYISWNRIPQPYISKPTFLSTNKTKRKPAPVSYLHIGNTGIIGHKKLISVQDDCVFEIIDEYSQNKNVYTVIDNDFIAKLDSTTVLYPVSDRIMDIFANNQKSMINLKTFQDLTGDMYQKLLSHRNKMK